MVGPTARYNEGVGGMSWSVLLKVLILMTVGILASASAGPSSATLPARAVGSAAGAPTGSVIKYYPNSSEESEQIEARMVKRCRLGYLIVADDFPRSKNRHGILTLKYLKVRDRLRIAWSLKGAKLCGMVASVNDALFFPDYRKYPKRRGFFVEPLRRTNNEEKMIRGFRIYLKRG